MKILLACSEVHPFSKTGGLGDMVGALAKTLARVGHRVGIVTPLYRGIQEKYPAMQKLEWWMDLPMGLKHVQAEVWTLEPEPGLTVYFIRQPAYYDRNGIYTELGVAYPDNGERYIFFSKAVVHLARYLPWQPEIVHVHDWQTALVPALILHQEMFDDWPQIPKTCLTIHNLAYQGIFFPADFNLTNLAEEFMNPNGAEFYGMMNCLKAGIAYADMVTTVSPRYAREITTEAYGEHLDGLLRGRGSALVGILNGVDYEEWNTEHNPYLPNPYSVENLEGKRLNKVALQKELGLPENPNMPLFGNISRLTDQKGTELILGAMEEMLASELQFVLLGTGDPVLEAACVALGKRHPSKVAARILFNPALSHRVEAACDFYLMPSRFEPCGLNQMYSLHYGTLPVVRATGGLDDSVVDIAENVEAATGIKFYQFSARVLARAIRKALVLYQTPALMDRMRRNAMQQDFSWQSTEKHYAKLYQRLLYG
ncbi:MAG: glycogen synthase GlgA [Verrucomicrobiota bacterium]